MFKVGQKIFYPMHGAGVIEAIEERDFSGDKKPYYIMSITHKEMQVMIPKGKEEAIGVRKVVEPDTLEQMLTQFHEGDTEQNDNQYQRHRIHIKKIKSGDIYECAEVIRDLVRLRNKKTLGTEDKNMLQEAQQIMISEIKLVKDIDTEMATELFESVINNTTHYA